MSAFLPRNRLRLARSVFLLAALALPRLVAAPRDAVRFAIKTSPPGAEIFLDGERVGTSPLELIGRKAGPHAFRILLSGHDTEEFLVNAVAGASYAYDIALKELTGTLILSVEPGDAELSIGDRVLSPGLNRLRSGVHVLRARRFGYEEETRVVSIAQHAELREAFSLSKAALRIERLSVSRKSFNPRDPYGLGETRISFQANGPGSGSLRIVSSLGETVRELSIPEFTEQEDAIAWNGKDEQGAALPEGGYRVLLDAQDDAGGRAEASAEVRIVSRDRIMPRLLSAMSSGNALCPDASILPVGIREARFEAYIPLEETASEGFPFKAGIRATLFPGLETTLSAHLAAGATDTAFAGSAKYRWLSLNYRLSVESAVYLRGAVSNAAFQAPQPTGVDLGSLIAGLPITIAFGPLSFTATPAAGIGFTAAEPEWRFGGASSIGFRSEVMEMVVSSGIFPDLPGIAPPATARMAVDIRFLTPSLISPSAGFVVLISDTSSVGFLIGAGFIF